MRVAAGQNYIMLSKKLAEESNRLAKKSNKKDYLRIENIDGLLSRRDMPVEKKKSILLKKLHESVIRAFSIDKKYFKKKDLASLKGRLHNIRKIVQKLRSINYYLETAFLRELSLAGKKMAKTTPSPKAMLAKDELGVLELIAYRLIGEAVILDKRLLKEYSLKEKKAGRAGKTRAKDLGAILKKESELLEHLEAKLPPPRAATIDLIKEPVFTHWVARIFALLSYIEHMYREEMVVFKELRSNKLAKHILSKKISSLLEEKSKLLRIMQEKKTSMEKLRTEDLRDHLRNFTTTVGL